jgi:hypothetical protein
MMFIVFRFTVASSSLCPPDRNMMPGMAGGTTRLMVVRVAAATASDEGLGPGYSVPYSNDTITTIPTVSEASPGVSSA